MPCVVWVSLALSFPPSARAVDVAAWRLLSSTTALPPALDIPLGVYDPVRHRVLAVAEQGAGGPLVVHVFDAAPEPHWSVLVTTGDVPPHAYIPALAYDSIEDRLLFYAGSVWALNLSGTPTWTLLSPTGAPPRNRLGASLVFDPVHDRAILFGGWDDAFYPAHYLSETWELSFSTNSWTQLTPVGGPPGGREGHGALYDPAARRMLVFGGHFEAGTRGFWNDLWQLSLDDAPTWTQLHPAGPIPGARSAFGTVYDPVRHRMLVHGGVNDQSGVEPDDLWALSLDGDGAWSKIEATNRLRGRSYPVDVYDPVTDALLACGGGGYPLTSKLSLADPTHWSSVLPAAPVPSPGLRSKNAVVYDARRDRFIALGGEVSTVDSSAWTFAPGRTSPWQPLSSDISPDFDYFYSDSHRQPAAYDSAGDRLLVRDSDQFWTMPAEGGVRWTALGPVAPFDTLTGFDLEFPGFEAGVCMDPREQRVIVCGGLQGAGHAAVGSVRGVWALSLGPDPQWTHLGDLPQVYGSAMHAAFDDALRNRLVLVGGIWNGGYFQIRRDYGPTVWTTPLDSALTWTDRSSLAGPLPPGPPDALAGFDVRRNRLFIFSDSTVWVRGVDDTGPWTELEFASPRPLVTQSVAYDPLRDQVVAPFAQTPGSDDVQVWALTYGPPSATLVESVVSPDAIALKWESPAAIGRIAALERREDGSAWTEVGPLAFDDSGLATCTDHAVHNDHAYDYRVRIGTAPWFSDAITVVMQSKLALLGGSPNPAIRTLQVRFTLPASGAARLEAFDIHGRRCASREVGMLGPGTHTVTLDDGSHLRPGVYLLRLQRAHEARSARVVLVR
jgi:hypothetical protein